MCWLNSKGNNFFFFFPIFCLFSYRFGNKTWRKEYATPIKMGTRIQTFNDWHFVDRLVFVYWFASVQNMIGIMHINEWINVSLPNFWHTFYFSFKFIWVEIVLSIACKKPRMIECKLSDASYKMWCCSNSLTSWTKSFEQQSPTFPCDPSI